MHPPDGRWLRVNTHPNYWVCDDGRVWSTNTSKEKLGFPDKKGYMRVQLRHIGKPFTYKVHRLVAIHFIPNPSGLPQVNHLNGVKNDNRVSNLEWCTNFYNAHHAMANGLFIGRKDLDPLVPKILGALIDGYRITDIAKKLKSSSTTIYRHIDSGQAEIDFNHEEVSAGLQRNKGYYWDRSRNRWRIDQEGLVHKQFLTEAEAQEYVISQRRELITKGIIQLLEPKSAAAKLPQPTDRGTDLTSTGE